TNFRRECNAVRLPAGTQSETQLPVGLLKGSRRTNSSHAIINPWRVGFGGIGARNRSALRPQAMRLPSGQTAARASVTGWGHGRTGRPTAFASPPDDRTPTASTPGPRDHGPCEAAPGLAICREP